MKERLTRREKQELKRLYRRFEVEKKAGNMKMAGFILADIEDLEESVWCRQVRKVRAEFGM